MAPTQTKNPDSPPTSPPVVTAYQDSGGGGHVVQVTRNVPPKRVMVTPGTTIVYGGVAYEEGDTFVHGEGPAADQLAFDGKVVVVDHDAVDAWNGEEGEAIRKTALAKLDADHKTAGTTRTHDHGFAKYKHADGPNSIPVDVTQHRQQLGAEHSLRGGEMSDDQAGLSAKGE